MNLKPFYEEFKTTLLIFGVIAWAIFLIIPMPGIIIDLCISASLAFSMIVLLTSSTIDSWDKLRTFPMILLMSTIFRIAFNIATTRKIISGGNPGSVIESAGHLIVQDEIIIGLVMFIILLIVQFIVANGASRFGEVSARFMLDALPGKQMSIDNELNQGAIDDQTAKKQKRRLQMQVDFYGSLDGAGKYIKGDVFASIAMIVVNLIVGLIVGMVELDLPFAEAANRFTLLTVGDGVVNLISALMITVSGAIVMAKVEEDNENGEAKSNNVIQRILQELIPNSRNLYIAGSVLIVLGITGLPFFQLAVPGALLIFAGYMLQRNKKAEEENKANEELRKRKTEQTTSKEVKVKRSVEPVVLEVGYKLAPYFMADSTDVFGNKKESIHDKTDLMRQIFANKLGIKIPAIKIRDNVSLHPSTKYVIKVKESAVASGVIKKDKILAIPTPLVISEIEGEKTKDPIFGQEAYWIDENQLDEAADKGYDVWSPITIIATHLHQIMEKNLYQFISLQQVADMVQEVGEEHPILKDKMDKIDDLYLLQKVIVSLLKEKVSIKDLPTIIESFIEAYNQTKDIDTIVSFVRQRISRQICENYINNDGKLYLISLKDEEELVVNSHNGVNVLSMNYDWQVKFLERLKKEKDNARTLKIEPVIVTQRPELRPAISRMMENFDTDTPVISIYELPSNVKNKVIASI
ncbi:flagellar biosynthesis protein FlhA [Priestia megaterium]|uniref:Flagellar type III secretion system protein FlhA n=1 Tax=Priestia megaterium TaxID=1404 RepID=A0A6M6E4R5_PRIMG|nr:flagellar biosynthesis protein FlhA [Priestia megaterium]QJX80576.1 flagellar type III secretion system protein FlhA [Priestia megaterium]